MKFTASKDLLVVGTQTVMKAVVAKATMPILAGIRMEIDGDTLSFAATDLEIGITCSVAVSEVESNGVVVVVGRTFADAVKSLPDVPIEVEAIDNILMLRHGANEFAINCFRADEFPVLPTLEGDTIKLPTSVFKGLVKQAVVAAGKDENRPVFLGALITCENGQLTIAATDTHRMAVKTVPVAYDGSWKALVPAKALSDIDRLLGDSEELSITQSGTMALFAFGSVTFTTRLIDGAFPDYKKVIPAAAKTKVTVNAKDLLGSVGRASIVGKEGTAIKFSFEEGLVKIDCATDSGKINEQLNIAKAGEDIVIAFNPHYLADALKVVTSENIVVDLSGPLSPCVIRQEGEDNYLHLLLPVRVAA